MQGLTQCDLTISHGRKCRLKAIRYDIYRTVPEGTILKFKHCKRHAIPDGQVGYNFICIGQASLNPDEWPE